MKEEQQPLEGGPSVNVTAPARLHMGFMDMSGDLGRRFGSLGLCLSQICTRLTVREAKHGESAVCGPSSDRTLACVKALLKSLNLERQVRIEVEEAIPEHIGLGSGTQLSLAVGVAITRLFQLDIRLMEIANQVERGGRSGLGIGAFEFGGFLVDGGRGDDTLVPPVISHIAFPESWRVLLIFDHVRQGKHGRDERLAFSQLPKMASSQVSHICRLVLLQVLPALAEADYDGFGDAITEIQEIIGDHFAVLQGGRFSSLLVADVIARLKAQGIKGVGQSSWGPTGFAVLDNETRAYQLLRDLRARSDIDDTLSFMVCKARNRGADITVRGSRLPNSATSS
ncbi:MAG: GHMP kinase [Gammaproteobacteria bacterium]|nr:GHMP kinase [Gammaproteobacteria bacterium]MCI0590307.1 GHMP kinase [Gammaproteobacteria bacterium]